MCIIMSQSVETTELDIEFCWINIIGLISHEFIHTTDKSDASPPLYLYHR